MAAAAALTSAVAVKAWLGPAGTVSSLHFDAPHNLLAQVAGWKRVLLYPPLPHEVPPPLRHKLPPREGAGGGDPCSSASAGGSKSAGDERIDGGRAGGAALLPSMHPRAAPMANTSRAEPGPGAPARFPGFPPRPAYDVLLAPGQMLYIPPLWWHHVTALTLSYSVSFWWGSD